MIAARPLAQRPVEAWCLLSLGCFSLKWAHQQAPAEQFAWLLRPTTALVASLTGAEFVCEPGAGYLSRELSLLIAPACSGLNYFVICWAALTLGFLRHFDSRGSRLLWLLASVAIAYPATIVTSAARITLGVMLSQSSWQIQAMPAAELHRVEGIVSYFTSLLVVQALVAAAFARIIAVREGVGWWPLILYLAVTLGVPVLTGALARPGYFHHAIVVLGCAALLFAGMAWARSSSARVLAARAPRR